jgi:uncharacterized protein (DUF2267 family)
MDEKLEYGFTVKRTKDGKVLVDSLPETEVDAVLTTPQIFDEIIDIAQKIKDQRQTETITRAVMLGFRDVLQTIHNQERAAQLENEGTVEMPQ